MMSMEYSAIDMATLAFLASLCKDVAAAIGWHGAVMWAEVAGYGLALLSAVVLRFGHRLHVAAYGVLLGVTVLKALGTG